MGSMNLNTQTTYTQNLIMRWILIHRTYGIAYLFSWAHRVTGVVLLFFLWTHIYTLSYLIDPVAFDSKVKRLGQLGFDYFEWVLALPIIFHALNGGRLILYEIFGCRRDELLIKWITGLTIIYFFFLALVMAVSNMSLALSILDVAFLISIVTAGGVIIVISKSKIGIYWKIQRISGAFLLIAIPVHMIFMHVNPLVGHDSAVILSRIRSDMLIRVADFFIVASALYHGAYGLISIAKDYLNSTVLIRYVSILIVILSIMFGWLGIKTMAIL